MNGIGIDGRLAVPIGPDKTPVPPAIAVYGKALTDKQASALRELIVEACADGERYGSGPGAEFQRTCGEIYQLLVKGRQ